MFRRFRTIVNQINPNLHYEDMTTKVFLRLWAKSIVVGAVAGFFGATFRYLIQEGELYRHALFASITFWQSLGWVLLMIVLGWGCYKLLEWAPLSGGSGIPQIEAELMGIFNMRAARTLISKYAGGVMDGLCGFSVGREGPSIQLGGAAAKIVANWFKSSLHETRLLITAGAASGLTAAFSAPVASSMFAFEEVHKSFYPLLVVPVLTACMVANLVTAMIFGMGPSLSFTVTNPLPLTYFGPLIALGFFIGFIGIIFNKSILLFKRVFTAMPILGSLKIIATFLIVTMVGYDAQELLNGGNLLIGHIALEEHALLFCLGILAGKILLTSLCYGCGAQGGLFFPMLTIGASAGAFLYTFFVGLGWVPAGTFQANFAICAMSGILASAMRTPLLGILLVLEMSDSLYSFYQVGITAVIAYAVAELCKEIPIYDGLLELMLKNKKEVEGDLSQTFFNAKLSTISQWEGKRIQDLQLPDGVFIVSIERHGEHVFPEPRTILHAQDELYVSSELSSLDEAKRIFKE